MSQANEVSLLERELAATVRAGVFRDEALQAAVGALFNAHPQYRIEAALEMRKAD